MNKGILLIIFLFIVSCAIPYNIKTEKFETYPEVMQSFSGTIPMMVIIPQNAEKEYVVENLNILAMKGRTLYINLNDLHKDGKELIEEVLVKNKVPLSPDSTKYLKFTINKIQYEVWGIVTGTYFYFTIETSDGYKQQYKVQDQSGYSIDRAIGGAVSRAVEKVFQDRMIIKFIES